MKITIETSLNIVATVTDDTADNGYEVAQMFYRLMLAVGFSPHTVAEAFDAIAQEHLQALGLTEN